jgi:hypothetical protein
MVKKSLIGAMIFLFMAGFAFGQLVHPPEQGGYLEGWGMNPTNWQKVSGGFNTGIMICDAGGHYNNNFSDPSNPQEVVYEPIVLELWVELYAQEYYQYTSYQWHRIGNNAEVVGFDICGWVKSNNANWVGLTQGTQDMNFLHFMGGRYGNYNVAGHAPGADLPISWSVTYGPGTDWTGQGTTTALSYDQRYNGIGVVLGACDHWFRFRGEFTIPYHLDDGYYKLEIAGCPAPVL